MDSLSETQWDVVIEGTDLRQSLLALALSRSDKKVLHVDQNEYYGGAEAAFSLQEIDEWVEKVKRDRTTGLFRNASLWRTGAEDPTDAKALSYSRAYSLTLSPQIIYSKSKLLSELVSSKVYRQLEFQAVGNWWIYVPNAEPESPQIATLKRLPNGREDIFEDSSFENRAKRSLMKFLKFVVDYENHTEVWASHTESALLGFLALQFQLSPQLQLVISALTLSLYPPEETSVGYALPRIARHLTSIGVFGPGFGAVVPKWGGGAEIAQVACRAGAVGGGVYVLGTGITSQQTGDDQLIEVQLSNGEAISTKYLSRCVEYASVTQLEATAVSRIIAVVSSPLASLFQTSVEGSPVPAVSVIVFPPNTLTSDSISHCHPVYIMVHSSDAGECPAGQCVLYATTLHTSGSKGLLEAALDAFLATSLSEDAKLLYTVYYEQHEGGRRTEDLPKGVSPSLDLAFNDLVLEDVASEWKAIIGTDVDESTFMRFDERPGANEDDNDNDYEY